MSTPTMRSASSFLPVKPIDLLVLTMLAANQRHGYGIRQDILDYTEGRIEIEAGNLYRHVRRLKEDGLIERAPDASTGSSDERRQEFRITRMGRAVLAAELSRLRALLRFAETNKLAPVRRS